MIEIVFLKICKGVIYEILFSLVNETISYFISIHSFVFLYLDMKRNKLTFVYLHIRKKMYAAQA